MHILTPTPTSTSLALLAAALLILAPSPLVHAKCDRGFIPGYFCLDDCNGNGIYVRSPNSLVNRIDLASFQLDFDPRNPWNPLATANGVNVALTIPQALTSVPLTFTGASSSIDVGLPGGPLVGNILTPDWSPATGDSSTKILTLNINKNAFSLKQGQNQAYSDFFRATTLASGDFDIRMTGFANTRASVNAGGTQTCLRFVGFDVVSKLKGLGGLSNSRITALPSVLGGSPATGIELSIPLTVTSPSNIILNAPQTDVIFDLLFQSQKVGTVILPNLTLKPGENTYTAKSFVKPDPSNPAALTATRQLLTSFTGGREQSVLVSNGRSSNMPSLDTAFSSLNLVNTLPASKKLLIETARFTFPNLLNLRAKAGLTALNPFATPVEITKLTASLKYKGGVIGTISQDLAPGSMVIPPNGTIRSPPLVLNLRLDLKSIQALLAALKKGLKIETESTLTVSFGGYETVIDYSQGDIPTSLVFQEKNV
ncbi:hypothetical protein HDV05_007497 [Chytridiales sp. JEL 0842]|nr:hypothetical protein HDV05_007497 [Chytridiales sp. JEL 0842]